jgi:hypothetical protein
MPVKYTQEPSYGIMDALRLVLLFHDGEQWTPAKRAEWLMIAGTTEATTKVMCDHVRSALEIGARMLEPVGADDDAFFRVFAFEAGRTLSEADAKYIEAVLGDYNDELGERQNEWERVRAETLREVGGDELLNAVITKDSILSGELVARALTKYRDALPKKN